MLNRKLIAGLGLALLVAVSAGSPSQARGQVRMVGGYVQLSPPGRFGIAAVATGEVGVWRTIRLFGRWADWRAFEFPVEDASGFDPTTWELGVSSGFGVDDRVAPFVGGSFGVAPMERETHRSASAVLGLDFAVIGPLAFRLSMMHQVVFSARRRSHTSLLAGLGLARW
jgi:hypothetical protein